MDAKAIDGLYRSMMHLSVFPTVGFFGLVVLSYFGDVALAWWCVGLILGLLSGAYFHFERKWGYPIEVWMMQGGWRLNCMRALMLIAMSLVVVGTWFIMEYGVEDEALVMFATFSLTYMCAMFLELRLIPQGEWIGTT